MFKQGDTCYLEDGQAAEFVALHGDRVLVLPVMEDHEGAPMLAHPIAVHRCYESPPVERYHEEIATLRTTIMELSLEIESKRSALCEFEQQEKDRRDRIARHGLLETIDNFLAGRITHLVTISDYEEINIDEFDTLMKPAEQASSDKKDLRLLTLYGAVAKTKWMLAQYPDGGGSAKWVHPFTSFEAARDFAAKHLAGIFAEFTPLQPGCVETAAASARALGIEVPAHIFEYVQTKQKERAAARLLEAMQRVKHAEKELALISEATF